MADRIQVVPEHLRAAAGRHQQTSDYFRTFRQHTPRSRRVWTHWGRFSVSSAMPDANLLELRRQCYEQQADDHADMAAQTDDVGGDVGAA